MAVTKKRPAKKRSAKKKTEEVQMPKLPLQAQARIDELEGAVVEIARHMEAIAISTDAISAVALRVMGAGERQAERQAAEQAPTPQQTRQSIDFQKMLNERMASHNELMKTMTEKSMDLINNRGGRGNGNRSRR